MAKKEKSVFISGAASGIGRQCTMSLVDAGFRVIAGVRNKQAGEKLAQMAPGQVKPIVLDITKSKDIESATRVVSAENLYGIVNNAGIAVLGPLEFIPLEKIRQQFEVNLFGHIAVTQAFLPFLRNSGKGRIINISSISGFVAFPFFGPYASSKFALEAFSEALRRELKPWNIQVALIRPGNIKTPIWHKSFLTAQSIADGFPPEAEAYYGNRMMSGDRSGDNMTDPSVVAKAVLHALTASRPRSSYLVGRDARKHAFFKRLLPDWLFDRIL